MTNAVEMFNTILAIEEFGLIKYKDGTWGLFDGQGANLGDIESDRFNTMAEILDRMEIYHIDYFEESIMEYFEIYNYKDYVDLVNQCREKINNDPDEWSDYSDFDLRALEFIGMAPNLEICNKPLDEVGGLRFENEEL